MFLTLATLNTLSFLSLATLSSLCSLSRLDTHSFSICTKFVTRTHIHTYTHTRKRIHTFSVLDVRPGGLAINSLKAQA